MSAFIVAENSSIAARVRELLSFGGLDCPASAVVPVDGAAGRLGRESAIDLLVLILSAELERGLALLPTLARLAPGKVLAVGPSDDSRVVLRALRAGAADFVDAGDLESELDAAIARRAEAARGPAEVGRVVAVLGPSGGSGSSTIAASLAAALAREHKSAALVDLKLEGGDLATLLDLRPVFTVVDLCRNVARLDRAMFDRSLARHDSGVALLAAPPHPGDSGDVHAEGVEQVLQFARDGFPHVVVDVDHSYRDEQRVALRVADAVVVPIRLEFAALRHARHALAHLESIGVEADKVLLVANRSGQPQEVPGTKAEAALGRKIAHHLPNDPKVVNRAGNQGVPVVLSAPSAGVARALNQLAMMVDGRQKKK